MTNTEGLSKREQAAYEFARSIEKRIRSALQEYFLSHGGYVHFEQLSAASELPEHTNFIVKLRHLVSITEEVSALACDIGSISRNEKQKAMKALYETERICEENHGDVRGLREIASQMRSLMRDLSASPSLGTAILILLLGDALLFAYVPIGLTLMTLASVLIYKGMRSFRNKRASVLNEFNKASTQFDACVVRELAPRLLPSTNASFAGSSIGFAAFISLLCILGAISVSLSSSDARTGKPLIPPAGSTNLAASTSNAASSATNVDQASSGQAIAGQSNVDDMPGAANQSPGDAALPAPEQASPVVQSQLSSGASAPEPSYQTSFDCAKARSDAEHLICADAELAADDRELADLYTRAATVAADPGGFREHARNEWNYRERACHDRDCLVRWYADEKVNLEQIAKTGQLDGN
ncbi:hypothetical protein R75461_07867 [Paraburkholderia nemoris]|uniref:lysozyme inhibitor LprI family protein n=1 Tax=Paraburkholderia nemoris TaxID=2793076 RepID=UPI00190A7CDC|nr:MULTISPECIES: hypothetical protein [Paraburkholderia]MBK3786900.1 hypothetical protein [Paraburkholderia aspalathi]CAE6858744.1 hypothetical protein R75461_07867 [Paraburkholderia nemoris]